MGFYVSSLLFTLMVNNHRWYVVDLSSRMPAGVHSPFNKQFLQKSAWVGVTVLLY